jgi:hypothetical protein
MAERQLNLAPSTNVEAAIYDPDTQRLTLFFLNRGASGFYSGVSEQEALEFERSPSPGRYVHQFLATRFLWTRTS